MTGSGATGTGAGWIVPVAFAQRRIDRDGDAGRDWIAALPGVVADLLTRWALRVRPKAAPRYGDYALVLPVVRVTTGEPAVLKVGWQDGTSRAEAVGLVAWGGRGAVRLLENDPEAGALLLEQLGPRTLHDLPATYSTGRWGRSQPLGRRDRHRT